MVYDSAAGLPKTKKAYGGANGSSFLQADEQMIEYGTHQ